MTTMANVSRHIAFYAAGGFVLAAAFASLTAAIYADAFCAYTGRTLPQQEKQSLLAAPVYFEVPDIIVDISVRNRTTNLAKLGLVLVLDSDSDIPIARQRLPILTDAILSYIRTLQKDEVSGAENFQRMRLELLAICQKQLSPAGVQEVLFREFVFL